MEPSTRLTISTWSAWGRCKRRGRPGRRPRTARASRLEGLPDCQRLREPGWARGHLIPAAHCEPDMHRTYSKYRLVKRSEDSVLPSHNRNRTSSPMYANFDLLNSKSAMSQFSLQNPYLTWWKYDRGVSWRITSTINYEWLPEMILSDKHGTTNLLYFRHQHVPKMSKKQRN